jgi:hypothetical protein
MKLLGIILFALVGGAVLFIARRKSSPNLMEGGIYSTSDGSSGFSIVKLLKRERGICHICIYKQKFQSRPATIDIASLSLGKVGDPDGFGMGHIPRREAAFLAGQPVLIARVPVTSEELEGYKIWKEDGGGVF